MYPRAGLVDLGMTKIVPIRIQTPDHPAHRTNTMPTMLPKLQPRTGLDSPGLADLPPGKKPCTTTQEVRWAPGAVSTGTENLVPTPGYNLQTVQPTATSYTYIKKAYSGSRGTAPHYHQH